MNDTQLPFANCELSGPKRLPVSGTAIEPSFGQQESLRFAKVLFIQRQFGLAMDTLHYVKSIQSLDFKSANLLACCYLARGHEQEAIDLLLATANTLTLSSDEALQVSAILNELEQTGMALVIAKRVLVREPNHSQAAIDAAFYATRCALSVGSIIDLLNGAGRSRQNDEIEAVYAAVQRVQRNGEAIIPESWFDLIRTKPMIALRLVKEVL